VLLGSSSEVYNAEIGREAKCDQPTRLSVKQFFLELLPVITLAAIFPLVFWSGNF
jgi:hypothetical protein